MRSWTSPERICVSSNREIRDNSGGRLAKRRVSSALARSLAVQLPMPSTGSIEILGGRNVPKGEASANPPPRCRRSACPGEAWQDAQSPAAKTSFPRAASPAVSQTPPTSVVVKRAGAVRNQIPTAAATIAETAEINQRRRAFSPRSLPTPSPP